MKAFLFTMLVLFVRDANSCMCLDQKFTDKYAGADFIASVKIVRNYKNEGDQIFYKSDIVKPCGQVYPASVSNLKKHNTL
ncbi:hypothetical protein [Dyadobacter sp. LHD-138]|uniref:hypothetical protein n=1 Tax=Dyadobacter sp. LHD-138 TaxID=3071413 RepID=UPI0027E13431|nr:hypothetical protein [Dyadobacter sp. LHD-138]MDQ6481311.1 hypothetical protein [Dyadobacter sp. LHD-138]